MEINTESSPLWGNTIKCQIPMQIHGFISLIIAIAALGCTPTPAKAPTITDCKCSEWENWTDQDDVSCHYLTVPEDHDNPDGKKIRIAFAIFKATNPEASDTPIIYLTGGPGGRALTSMNRWVNRSLREMADLIVVEQRGIGLSSPLPLIGEQTFRVLADDLSIVEEKARTKAILEEVKQRMEDEGVDVSKYNSTQNAHDFEALMQVLDYGKYDLYGSSYGTRLAAGIMREYPEQVHAAILNGPANLDGKALEGRFPNLVLALSKLYRACEENPSCNEQYPDLQSTFVEALHGLAQEPITVRLDTISYTINPQDAVYLLRYLLYGSTGFETAPPFIHALRDRDIPRVEQLARAPMQFSRGSGITVFYAFQSYEEWSEDTPLNVETAMATAPELQYGLAWFHAFIPYLGEWSTARATAAEQTFRNIPVPALVIVNEFDPVTPPHHTRMFEDAITNCQVIRLKEFGHGSGGDCIDTITRGFLQDPTRPIDRSCL